MSKNIPVQAHNATSGGSMTNADYLDDHYAALQPEYERMLRMVGIKSGWNVLDAGCGGGSYLRLLDELVGESGQIMALDIAAENVQRVHERIQQGEFRGGVKTRAGDVVELPFPDNSFDAVWCANVTQYLNDDEVLTAFREFKRVVKPGGLVAVKEGDMTAFRFDPFPSDVLWRFFIADKDGVARGVLRAPEFAANFRGLGLEDVTRHTTLAERAQPLRPVEKRLFREMILFTCMLTQRLDLSEADKAVWHALQQVDDPQHILYSDDFFWRGSYNVTIGRVPKV